MSQTTSPVFHKQAFRCPRCHVYAVQTWYNVLGYMDNTPRLPVNGWAINACSHCNKPCLWQNGIMVYPPIVFGDPPNEDLLPDIKEDYREAARIFGMSPRGSAALLRLCIQKLMKQLGENGKTIDDDIKSLVIKGLPVEIQQALDSVRVIGNEAVHPGTMDLNDTPELAESLFGLVNIVADRMITQPKQISAIYANLPANKIKGIENRDNPKPKT